MRPTQPLPEQLERASLPTAAVSAEGRVIAANTAFCALLGREHHAVQDRVLDDLGVTFDDEPLDPDAELGDTRVEVRRAAGDVGPARLSWRQVRDGRGRPSYLHVVLFDERPRSRQPRAAEPQPPAAAEHGLERMLALHQEGASVGSIASALNREGYVAPTGRRWHPTSVARALEEALFPL